MGILDFEDQKEHLTYIQKVLSRRGLTPDLSEEWEIHGPHQGMNYQVYVGYALRKDKKEKCRFPDCSLPWTACKRHVNFDCVAIYPKAVYRIQEPSDWAKATAEDRIPIT